MAELANAPGWDPWRRDFNSITDSSQCKQHFPLGVMGWNSFFYKEKNVQSSHYKQIVLLPNFNISTTFFLTMNK